MVPVVSSEPGAHKVHRAWAHYLLYELHVCCVKNHCTWPYLCLCPLVLEDLLVSTTMCSYLDVIRGPLGLWLCGSGWGVWPLVQAPLCVDGV